MMLPNAVGTRGMGRGGCSPVSITDFDHRGTSVDRDDPAYMSRVLRCLQCESGSEAQGLRSFNLSLLQGTKGVGTLKFVEILPNKHQSNSSPSQKPLSFRIHHHTAQMTLCAVHKATIVSVKPRTSSGDIMSREIALFDRDSRPCILHLYQARIKLLCHTRGMVTSASVSAPLRNPSL